jgi:hypothetical protein
VGPRDEDGPAMFEGEGEGSKRSRSEGGDAKLRCSAKEGAGLVSLDSKGILRGPERGGGGAVSRSSRVGRATPFPLLRIALGSVGGDGSGGRLSPTVSTATTLGSTLRGGGATQGVASTEGGAVDSASISADGGDIPTPASSKSGCTTGALMGSSKTSGVSLGEGIGAGGSLASQSNSREPSHSGAA